MTTTIRLRKFTSAASAALVLGLVLAVSLVQAAPSSAEGKEVEVRGERRRETVFMSEKGDAVNQLQLRAAASGGYGPYGCIASKPNYNAPKYNIKYVNQYKEDVKLFEVDSYGNTYYACTIKHGGSIEYAKPVGTMYICATAKNTYIASCMYRAKNMVVTLQA